ADCNGNASRSACCLGRNNAGLPLASSVGLPVPFHVCLSWPFGDAVCYLLAHFFRTVLLTPARPRRFCPAAKNLVSASRPQSRLAEMAALRRSSIHTHSSSVAFSKTASRALGARSTPPISMSVSSACKSASSHARRVSASALLFLRHWLN